MKMKDAYKVVGFLGAEDCPEDARIAAMRRFGVLCDAFHPAATQRLAGAVDGRPYYEVTLRAETAERVQKQGGADICVVASYGPRPARSFSARMPASGM